MRHKLSIVCTSAIITFATGDHRKKNCFLSFKSAFISFSLLCCSFACSRFGWLSYKTVFTWNEGDYDSNAFDALHSVQYVIRCIVTRVQLFSIHFGFRFESLFLFALRFFVMLLLSRYTLRRMHVTQQQKNSLSWQSVVCDKLWMRNKIRYSTSNSKIACAYFVSPVCFHLSYD